MIKFTAKQLEPLQFWQDYVLAGNIYDAILEADPDLANKHTEASLLEAAEDAIDLGAELGLSRNSAFALLGLIYAQYGAEVVTQHKAAFDVVTSDENWRVLRFYEHLGPEEG